MILLLFYISISITDEIIFDYSVTIIGEGGLEPQML